MKKDKTTKMLDEKFRKVKRLIDYCNKHNDGIECNGICKYEKECEKVCSALGYIVPSEITEDDFNRIKIMHKYVLRGIRILRGL